jgi:hypothetical protein
MSHLKYALSGLLGVIALAAVAPGLAHADGLCWRVPDSDTIIKQSSSSVLLWQADGDLALYASDNMAQSLWHSDTAGMAFELCSSTDGALEVYDEEGGKLWSKSGSAAITTASLELTNCTLSAKYKLPVFGTKVTLWSIAGTCPNTASQTTALNGWCTDTTSEQTIIQSEWAKLVWQTSGKLVLTATGIDDGTTIWSSSTAGSELCFEDSGNLVIYNASNAKLWESGATGSDDVAYTLGLKGCSLNITAFTGGTLWSSASTCPQTWNNAAWTVFKASSDKTLVENDDAELVFTTTGALILRSKAGKQFWTSGTSGTGNRLVFQSDGNLVIYPSSGSAVWASGTNGQSATQLKIDGCSFSLTNGGSTTYFSRGSSSCATSARSLDGTTITKSGTTRVLQTEEAYLDWESTGNLVLHSMGGSTLWSSGTSGTGKKLALQTDGNLVIYNSAGAAVWSSGTAGVNADTINLDNDCAFTVKDGSTARWTGNSSCAVMSYSYENSQGNSTFGVVMSTAMTAENLGVAEVSSTSGLDLTLFGNKTALFQATAYQTSSNSGSSLETGSIEILGNSMDYGVNVSYEKEFWSKSKTFVVGIVPVAVTASATGTLGMSLTYSSGALKLTPSANLSASIQAGVGVGSDVAGASAGVRGSLTLIDLSLPVSLKIFTSSGQTKFTVAGDLTLETLSGSLALYAEAYVKVFGFKVGVDWSYKLFSWTGLSFTRNLFSKTSSF